MIEQSSIGYSVYIDDDSLNYGLLGEGKTVKEALEDFNLSYKEMKEYYEEIGKPFEEVEFDFYFDIASFIFDAWPINWRIFNETAIFQF